MAVLDVTVNGTVANTPGNRVLVGTNFRPGGMRNHHMAGGGFSWSRGAAADSVTFGLSVLARGLDGVVEIDSFECLIIEHAP